MKMYQLREDAGQTIDVSYGYGYDGTAYQRVHDRAERTVDWYRGRLDWDREPEEIDYDNPPCVVEWVACDEPKDEEDEEKEGDL